MLVLAAVLLLAGALVLRDRHRRDSVYLIDAAGVAILALGLTFVVQLLFGAVVDRHRRRVLARVGRARR